MTIPAEILGIYANNTGYSDITMHGNDLATALSKTNCVYIPKNTTVTLSSTLRKINLDGKRIVGEGLSSIVKVVGNITAFDVSMCSSVFINDFLVEVETTNTSDIFAIGTPLNTAGTQGVHIKNISIKSGNFQQGLYTGFKMYSDGRGNLNNSIENVNIYYPNIGILMHAEKKANRGLAWFTSNLIRTVFIRGPKTIGLETRQSEIDNAGCQISHNIFDDVMVQDLYNVDTVRRGIVIGGNADTYIACRTFSDSLSGTFYGLTFNANLNNLWTGQYNNIIGGTIEGLIENIEYRDCNTVSTFQVAQKNISNLSRYDGFKNIRNNFVNVLRNGNLINGTDYWDNAAADTMELIQDATSVTGRCLRTTKAISTGLKILKSVPNRSIYAGKKVTFIALVKCSGFTDPSTSTVAAIIDEGVKGASVKSRNMTGDYQLLTVDRLIDGGGEALNLQINPSVGIDNITIDIAWAMLLVDGYARVSEYMPPQNSIGITTNTGTAVIPSGSTSVVVTHNISGIPKLHNIHVNPTNNLGNATKYWIVDDTSNQFSIYVDVDPGATTATFSWAIKE